MKKSNYDPKSGPWRFEYVLSARIKGATELALMRHTVFAYNEADADEAVLDLLRDEGGIIAIIRTESMAEVEQ